MASDHPPRALIVEDHDATRRALAAIFRRKGFRVDAAGTLTEGLALLAPEINCIILDLMLPDGGGEWLLVKVRQDRPLMRVIVTTGCEDRERLQAVRALGPDALLLKPAAADALIHAGSGSPI